MLRRTLLLCVSLMLAACSPFTAAPTSVRQSQVVAGVKITLDAPSAPQVNQEQRFIVTLEDDDGHPIDDADVYLDLVMPTMPMGMNHPEAVVDGPGRYRTNTVYTMSGEWQITVVATIEQHAYRATFLMQVLAAK